MKKLINYYDNQNKFKKVLFIFALIALIIASIYLFLAIIIAIIWSLIKYKAITAFATAMTHIQIAVVIFTVISIIAIVFAIIWYRVDKMDSKKIKNKKENNLVMREMNNIPTSKKIILSKNIGLPISSLNQHTLLIGTTGSGKTTSLLKIIKEIKQKTNSPIIIIDGKGDIDLITKIKSLDKNAFIWSIDSNVIYNPLSSKNPVMLADKIMSLFEFSEKYYENVAHNYLLKLLTLLIEKNIDVTFENIIKYFPINALKKIGYGSQIDFNQFNEKDISGLLHKIDLSQTQLKNTIGNDNSLTEIFSKHNIVLFSLNSLTYPKLAGSVGKIIIQDIKEFLTIKSSLQSLNLILDEFNVFVTDHVINLINKGRGYKLNCLLAFQTNNDLKMQGKDITDTIYGNCSNIICHKINDPNTANYVASIYGTNEIDEVTKQIDFGSNTSTAGSIRRADEFKAHPDDIKRLAIGQAYIKIPLPSGKIFIEKIKVEQ